jgi:gliding motility-associated-like protein
MRQITGIRNAPRHFRLTKMLIGFVLSLLSFDLNAQDILLLSESFETGGSSFSLNNSGPGSNNGNNQWIINDEYIGAPTYSPTTSQDNTVSGTIGGAPNSSYLHIHNVPSGITNNNYSPTATSDQFAFLQYGFCTYGMTDVHFSFFWLSEGSATAYGSVYYSVEGGPWTQFGQSQYNNSGLWQYEDYTNPVFDDVGSLRFGFRWENNNAVTPFSQSFSIDDINVVATYGVQDPVTISITSVSPNPVCEGSFLTISYALSDTLCDGNYQISLSNGNGNFPSPFGSWVMPIFYPQTSGTVSILLPAGAAADDCYRIRISRTSPEPLITGISSDCFEIIECPNVIITQQPVVTMDPFPVCIGSVIDVPFTSTGIYENNNTYICQLSEPDGTFSNNPPIVGSSPDNSTYDPSLGQLPGNVSGLIPETVDGCNYYLRVISTNPDAIGSVWGPFCIQHCDIETNNTEDISFCIHGCATDPDGEDYLIDININEYDQNSTYGPGNVFTTQLLSSQDFSQIGPNGLLGQVTAVSSTQLSIHIPCLDELAASGIPLGMNYLRIVSTNSSDPDNTLGTLIRLTVGVYHDQPQVIASYEYPLGLPRDTFCVGETAMLLFSPWNFSDQSTFLWECNGINGGDPFVSPSGANSNSLFVTIGAPGTLTFSIQETNFGCVGEWTPPVEIVALGDPNINITGPANVCLNDTNTYQVTFTGNTYYSWSSNAPPNAIAYQDTSNNVMSIAFDEVGNYTLLINVLNQCGMDNDNQIVHVLPFPITGAGPDTLICIGESTQMSTPTGSGYSYDWSDGTTSVGTTNTVTVTPDASTAYVVTIENFFGCQSLDTVNVEILFPDPPIVYYDSLCDGGNTVLTLFADSVGTYVWDNGSVDSFLEVDEIGTYNVSIEMDSQLCPHLAQYEVSQYYPDAPVIYEDSLCVGGNPIQLQADSLGSYTWGNGSNSSFLNVSVPGTYELSILIPGRDCPWLEEFEVGLINPEPPVIYPEEICEGGNPIQLQADEIGECEWSDGSTNNFLDVDESGTYNLSVLIDDELCPHLAQYEVMLIYPNPAIVYSDSICPGGENRVYLISDSVGIYTWQDGSTNSGFLADDIGTYSLSVLMSTQLCPHLVEYNVVPMSPPPPVMLLDSVCPNSQSGIFLEADIVGSYFWDNGSMSRRIRIYDIGTYSVEIYSDTERCPRTLIFDVIPDSCSLEDFAQFEELIYHVPNAFTPNSNQINDEFVPVFSNNDLVREYKFTIFDRWGEPVFVSTEVGEKWTGEFMGGDYFVADGVYTWLLEFRNVWEVDRHGKRGHLTIVR